MTWMVAAVSVLCAIVLLFGIFAWLVVIATARLAALDQDEPWRK